MVLTPLSFADFTRDKASVWTGTDTAEYDEIDRHHAFRNLLGTNHDRVNGPADESGDESHIEGKRMKGFPDFGRNMLKFWKLHPDCTYVSMLR